MTEKQKEGDVAYPKKLVKWKGLPSQSVKALGRKRGRKVPIRGQSSLKCFRYLSRVNVLSWIGGELPGRSLLSHGQSTPSPFDWMRYPVQSSGISWVDEFRKKRLLQDFLPLVLSHFLSILGCGQGNKQRRNARKPLRVSLEFSCLPYFPLWSQASAGTKQRR